LRTIRHARALGTVGCRRPGGEEADEARILSLRAALLGKDPKRDEALARGADVSQPAARAAHVAEEGGVLTPAGGAWVETREILRDLKVKIDVASVEVRAAAQEEADRVVDS